MKRESVSPVLSETLVLLQESDTPLTEIATATGLGYEWLKKLRAGSIPDPSVNRIHRLHSFLARQSAA